MGPKSPLNWGFSPPPFLLPSSTRSLIPLIPLTQLSQPSYNPKRTIKSINEPRPDRFAYDPKRSPLESTTAAALARKAHSTPLRTGALAIKRGMTAIYDPDTGKRTPCTVLQLDRNEVIAHKTREKNGYYAVQVGAGLKRADNVTRPMLGHFATARVSPKRWVVEFKVRGEEGLGLGVGESISAAWFREGQFVDVRGISRGMGFAGGMKRHGWGGQPASHGQSLMHRGMGSSGGGQGSGSRVHPGKPMAGNMGNERVTVQNLKVLKVDDENGIVVVNGCVPGPKYQTLRIQDAIKKPWPDSPMTLAEITSRPAVAAQTTA
ncbi:mitochondrial 54S ribosomal protein YmL9 [Zopfia rhizophila CBS 207.26]|uniref:Large ribosomal subunit protein uL3m n=1 Tax=Zopfia rhizophila CBS 207.26 TaxID=1314779 RepID=A0A6A6DF44_9PEZI|nr:mitochondrial 54S ribosomal protein YmL9 [Zopfia rhizophila CBS 207.26]